LWVEIWEGLSWLWHQPLLCFIALLGCVVHVVGSGMILLVIVLAQHQHTSTFITGLVLGVGGAGTLLGSLFGGLLQKKFSFTPLTISTIWLMALLFPLYILAPNILWLGVVTAVLSTIMSIYGVVQFSYRLALIPDELQGRVNSVFRLIVFGGDPIGLALTGVLLQAIGTVPAVLIYAAGLVVLAAATTLNRHVRAAHTTARARTT
jgi:predicted MFS family arabinose efflux permease